MRHFVVKFSKFSLPQAARGLTPLTKILRTPLIRPTLLTYALVVLGSVATIHVQY